MVTIGVVTNQENPSILQNSKLNVKKNQIVTIENEDELHTVDILILEFINDNFMPEVVRWLLAAKEIPNLFVWVLRQEENKQEARLYFELGASYVLSIPQDEEILNYTLNNMIVHAFSTKHEATKESLLNSSNQSIDVAETRIPLTRLEYKLFDLMVENKNTTVSYEKLAKSLWPNKSFQNVSTLKIQLANIVFHLRKKLDGENICIQTTRGKGYILLE